MKASTRHRRRADRELASAAKLREGLRDGERLIATYAWDFAECDCGPVRSEGSVYVIAVATKHNAIDRCFGCGKQWMRRARRRLDRRMSEKGVA